MKNTSLIVVLKNIRRLYLDKISLKSAVSNCFTKWAIRKL